MGACELCGKDGAGATAIVEGSQMSVCANCSKFGRVVRKPVQYVQKTPVPKAPEVSEVVVSDYAQRIHQAREKLGLTMKDFALKLNEKESIVHKLENGEFTPPLDMAKKLEKMLRIKLVEVEQEESAPVEKKSSGTLTIGDIIASKMKTK